MTDTVRPPPNEIPPDIAAEDRSDLPIDRSVLINRLKTLQPELSALGVSSLWLFGSYARGDADKWSDIDVLIEAADAHKINIFSIQRVIERPFRLHADVFRVSNWSKVGAAIKSEKVRIF